MENKIKSLYEKGDFVKVLTETNNHYQKDELIYRLLSSWRTGDEKLSWSIIEENRTLLEIYLPLLLQVHLDLLTSKGDLAISLKEYEYYRNLPYFSQEVEDQLKTFYSKTTNPKKEIFANSNVLSIRKLLSSNQAEKIWAGLQLIKKDSIKDFSFELEALLARPVSPTLKTFALLNLVAIRYEKEVTFEKNHLNYEVIPSVIEPPFTSNSHIEILKLLEKIDKDPSFFQMASLLYKQYIVACYPQNPLEDRLNEVAASLAVLVYRYMGLNERIPWITNRFNLSNNVLLESIEEMETILKENQDFFESV